MTKKKCFDAFAVRTRAHFSSKTKQNNERRREEEQRRSMLYFSPAVFFFLLFFRRETGGGEEDENGVVCWGWERRCIFTAATINKQGEKKTGHRGTCSSLALVIGRALCTCTSRASKDQLNLLSTLLFILLDAAFPSSLPLFWFSSLHCLSFSPRPRSRLTC